MKNFWQTLPIPFTILAPMDGVTDVVFRQMVAYIGRPNIFFTEFTSCDGIVSKGREKVAERLWFKSNEQPVVAQIWGNKPETFFKSAEYVASLGFSGIDINMGCPDKAVVKSGSCSGLMRNPSLAKEIVLATREGANGLPVSVKTRLGFSKIQTEEWIGFLLSLRLPALSIHLRTVKEMSKVSAHWEEMKKIMQMRNTISPETLIVGNGDLISMQEVKEKYKEYGCEGFMVGRGIFSNPWFFNSKITLESVSIIQRLKLYLKHIELYEKTWGPKKHYAPLRKFCKTYINNFPDASTWREKMMTTSTSAELKKVIKGYMAKREFQNLT